MNVLRKWVKEFGSDPVQAFPGHGQMKPEHREIGLRRPGDRTGLRVHDFRHRFAIRTLLDWYREGKDVEQQLPVLSTYLGHACVRDTYWYLSACPS